MCFISFSLSVTTLYKTKWTTIPLFSQCFDIFVNTRGGIVLNSRETAVAEGSRSQGWKNSSAFVSRRIKFVYRIYTVIPLSLASWPANGRLTSVEGRSGGRNRKGTAADNRCATHFSFTWGRGRVDLVENWPGFRVIPFPKEESSFALESIDYHSLFCLCLRSALALWRGTPQLPPRNRNRFSSSRV